MPRRIRVLRDQDLLARPSQVPSRRQHPAREVRQRHRSPTPHVRQEEPAGAAQPLLQVPLGHGPGLPGLEPGLLRAGLADRDPRHARTPVQQDIAGHRRLRPALLRSRLPHQDREGEGEVRLQVLLVLLRQVQGVRDRCGAQLLLIGLGKRYRTKGIVSGVGTGRQVGLQPYLLSFDSCGVMRLHVLQLLLRQVQGMGSSTIDDL